MALTKDDIKTAKEMDLIIGADQYNFVNSDGLGDYCKRNEDAKRVMTEEEKEMDKRKNKYLELVKMIKEEHHWASKTGMILANETNNHFSSNVEADNFLRGVTYVTLELIKKIKEMEKEDENDTTEL